MTEIQTITPNWLEDEPPTYKKLRALREATPGCPCEICPGYSMCKQTGHECESFKTWARTGSTEKEKT